MRGALYILFVAAPLLAQTSRGTVAGTVTDAFDARVGAASVTLTNTETGVSQTTAANPAGLYRFDAVDLGRYNLKVTHPGFMAFTGVGFLVEANRTTTIDPRLQVGASETAIEVNAEASDMIVRDGPLRGGNFQPRDVRDLPLISSNPISLARTLPGVIVPSGSTTFGGDAETTQFSVNGQRIRGNNYLLDGTENNEIGYTGTAQPFNIVDAVQEVSVQTGNFSVEFGRAGAGVFNVVTKSGTNSLHGTLLWRFQSQRFNSAANLDKLNGIPKSVYTNNIYGFTAGGPIRKNKTFFFAAFQEDTRHSSGNFSLDVPTAAAVDRLRTLFPSNPRLDLYLGFLGNLRGSGQPANSYRYAAFSGFDPAKFFQPSRVNSDNNNFGPAFGLAWSPSYRSGLAGKLFGDRKSVWRGGYQVSYDPFFNQLLSIFIGPATPNSVQTQVIGAPTSRGTPNWYGRIPTVARPASLLDAQNLMDKNIRNSYTERWSFGLQRELPARLLLDLAYVGSESHKLDLLEDANVQQPNGIRLHPDFGDRGVITSQGNSAYHALQALLNRRFARGVSADVSYTWSKNLDSVSDVGGVNDNSQAGNRTSLPASQGGLKLDRGLSDYDRAHRLSVNFLWQLPGLRRGLAGRVLGGWMLSGIAAFQSGVPFTVLNASDRNGDGRTGNDRPDIGNPSAPLNSHAVVAPATGARACPTGYNNPETGACVRPDQVHFVEGRGYPNAATVGRNTLRAGGINNLDAGLFKSFTIYEKKRIEFRWDALNAFNHPQFTSAPPRNVQATAAGRFLNPDFTDARTRSMWGQVKVVF